MMGWIKNLAVRVIPNLRGLILTLIAIMLAIASIIFASRWTAVGNTLKFIAGIGIGLIGLPLVLALVALAVLGMILASRWIKKNPEALKKWWPRNEPADQQKWITRRNIGIAWLLIFFMLLVGMPWFLAGLFGKFTIFLLLAILGITMFLLLPSGSDNKELLRRWTRNIVMIVFCFSVFYYFLPDLLDYYSGKHEWVEGTKERVANWLDWEAWASSVSTLDAPGEITQETIIAKPGEWSEWVSAPPGAKKYKIMNLPDKDGDIAVRNPAGTEVVLKKEEVSSGKLKPLFLDNSDFQVRSLGDEEVPLTLQWQF